MMQLNHHMFFFKWQMLYAATNPRQLTNSWKVDGVNWERERHDISNKHYTAHIQVHRLTSQRSEKIDWQLMVVIQEWWGPDAKKAIRSTNWCKAVIGDPKRIVAWLKKQDTKRETTGGEDEYQFAGLPGNTPVLH